MRTIPALLLLAVSALANGLDSVVKIDTGWVSGSGTSVRVYKGIPYAAPPVGPLRWKPPQPAQPWKGILVAKNFPANCPQMLLPGPQSEDCLGLNIWTPAHPAGALLPVMVWIHGGGFQIGASSQSAYDGEALAAQGVVVVSINYRLGIFGFLAHPALNQESPHGVSGNYALLDMVAALQWVQRNIAAFGGDPANVTVFGESAGAMSVATLLTMPRAKGLFRRAIVQSGNTPKVNSAKTAERIARRLAGLLGVELTRDAIATIPPERVLQAQTKLREDLLSRPDPAFWCEVALSYLPWAPIVDGETIPESPIARIAAGAAADIDLLVGSNLEETRLFFVVDGSIDHISEETVATATAAYGLPTDGVNAYRAAHPGASPGELLSAIQTDWYWRIPAVRMADAHVARARASTYMYEFAWRSPQFGGRLGAAHSVEIPFVFDTLGLGTDPLLGRTPPQSLAAAMHKAWVTFAAIGDCGWSKYDIARRPTMHFDTVSELINDPLAPNLARWEGSVGWQ